MNHTRIAQIKAELDILCDKVSQTPQDIIRVNALALEALDLMYTEEITKEIKASGAQLKFPPIPTMEEVRARYLVVRARVGDNYPGQEDICEMGFLVSECERHMRLLLLGSRATENLN